MNNNMYFRLEESYTRSVVGINPQLELKKSDYNQLNNSLADYQVWLKKPDRQLILPEVRMNSSAKFTDVLSTAFLVFGLIINGRAKQIFEKYKLGDNFMFYNLPLAARDEEYFLLYVQNEFLEYVNFKETEFTYREMADLNRKKIVINDASHYLIIKKQFNSEGKQLSMGKVLLRSSFPRYDLFWFSKASNQKYVSERLMKDLKTNKITGVEFSDAFIEIEEK